MGFKCNLLPQSLPGGAGQDKGVQIFSALGIRSDSIYFPLNLVHNVCFSIITHLQFERIPKATLSALMYLIASQSPAV